MHYNRQGLAIRYDSDGAGGLLRVPVRRMALYALSTKSGVQSIEYVDAEKAVLVGDTDGYVTKYDISKVLDLVGPKPVELKKR